MAPSSSVLPCRLTVFLGDSNASLGVPPVDRSCKRSAPFANERHLWGVPLLRFTKGSPSPDRWSGWVGVLARFIIPYKCCTLVCGVQRNYYESPLADRWSDWGGAEKCWRRRGSPNPPQPQKVQLLKILRYFQITRSACPWG